MPSIRLDIRNTGRLSEDDWDDLCDRVLARLEELTPVDTGFCQSNWEMSNTLASASFTNDTEYASYLDRGWSSQAPDGMIGPLLDELPDMLEDYE